MKTKPIELKTLLLLLILSGCMEGAASHPPATPAAEGSGSTGAAGGATAGGDEKEGRQEGTIEEANRLLHRFLEPGADPVKLSSALRPGTKDYEAVFEGGQAASAQKAYDKAWDAGEVVITHDPEQTQILIWSATTEDLKGGTGDASQFPGGYAKAAPFFKPGLTFFRFKFVTAGSETGMAYDGLVSVNGRWVIFPKPWRVIDD